jgi:hypothetical protein
MNRMTAWSDTGAGGSASASTSWEYDAAGNVRYVESGYHAIDAQGDVASGDPTIVSEWYLYDAMNRFTVTKGVLTGSRGSGTIDKGANGTQITYYLDGNRKTALYAAAVPGTHWEFVDGSGQQVFPNFDHSNGTWQSKTFTAGGLHDRREDYFYSADGYLARTDRADAWADPGDKPAQTADEAPEPVWHDPPTTGTVLATSTLDAMGRTIYYKEYGGGVDGSYERSSIVYDYAGHVTSETDARKIKCTVTVIESPECVVVPLDQRITVRAITRA